MTPGVAGVVRALEARLDALDAGPRPWVWAVTYGVPSPAGWRCRHWTRTAGHSHHDGRGPYSCPDAAGRAPKVYAARDGVDLLELI